MKVINRPVGAENGAGGLWGMAPRDFENSVSPIPTRGADYAHHITTPPPYTEFLDLPTALYIEIQSIRTVIYSDPYVSCRAAACLLSCRTDH